MTFHVQDILQRANKNTYKTKYREERKKINEIKKEVVKKVVYEVNINTTKQATPIKKKNEKGKRGER